MTQGTIALLGSPISGISQFRILERGVGLPFPSAEDLSNQGLNFSSSMLTGRFFNTEPPGKPQCLHLQGCNISNLHIWPQVQTMVSNFCLLVIKRVFVALADYSISFLSKI